MPSALNNGKKNMAWKTDAVNIHFISNGHIDHAGQTEAAVRLELKFGVYDYCYLVDYPNT